MSSTNEPTPTVTPATVEKAINDLADVFDMLGAALRQVERESARLSRTGQMQLALVRNGVDGLRKNYTLMTEAVMQRSASG